MQVLYKKNKNGSIQEWQGITVFNDIIVIYGKFGGKMQNLTTTCIGKQGRTDIEQAKFELKSLIKSKRDEGYKSIEDLGIYNFGHLYYFLEPMSEKDTRGFDLEYMLNALLELDTTDASGNIKPMLAHPIKNDKKDNWNKVKYPIAGEPKLDGVRCLISLKHCQGGINVTDIQAISREGKSYDFGTTKIREALIEIFVNQPNIILDGELYVHEMPQNRISGAMRTGKYNPEIHDSMEYHIYDLIDLNNKDLIYSERKALLMTLVVNYANSYQIKFIPDFILDNKEEVDDFELRCIEEGYEGIMLKPLDGKYEIGKRSYNNLKVKQFLDEEFEIVGYELGKRGSEDIVFILKTKEGKEFKAKPVGNRELKQGYYQAFQEDITRSNLGHTQGMKIVGKMATVKFKFYSEFGIPNHCQVKDIRDYE